MSEAFFTDTIRRLVEAQIGPWRSQKFLSPFFQDRLIEMSNSHHGVFVFTVDSNNVSFRANPGVTALIESGVNHEVYRRAVVFRNFIEEAVKDHPIDGSIVFALNVLDLAESSDLPVFSFQKKLGESNILLPDFELIQLNFLEAYVDTKPFLEKRDKAYFTGSTTGVSGFTLKDVNAGHVARIRAARAFRSCDEVDFRLTNIVQQADESVREALIVEGFGGEPAPLLEPFDFKFGISIDGNGAPCSRPAVILKSKGTLLKYNSPYILFYNIEMIDGVHYIGVETDEDIVRIVQEERLSPGLHASVAEAGQSFFNNFLTRTATIAYTSQLLHTYHGLTLD